MAPVGTPVLDRPWRRPGGLRYAAGRARNFLRPPVTVWEPTPGTVVSERNAEVVTRDGTVLRVNVYRPPGDGPFPVLMSAHPYRKDTLPRRRGRRSIVAAQYRLMNQPAPVEHSTLTGWEAPDPAWWVEQGYAVVNADLRGAGTSDGVGSLLSDQEAEDVYDLVEWAGAQAWSTGRVGLVGVSYLAMSQYKAAALGPPSLAAICPWEGMTDIYRDLMCPGGVYEKGFATIWTAASSRVARLSVNMGRERSHRPLRDDWWQSYAPDLARITVPMLVCASFSDNNLHSRGSFRAFERVGSADRFAYTHRGPSGPPSTAPERGRPRRTSSTGTCAATPSPRPHRCGSRYARTATTSSRSATSRSGPWPAPSGGRCTSHPAGTSPTPSPSDRDTSASTPDVARPRSPTPCRRTWS